MILILGPLGLLAAAFTVCAWGVDPVLGCVFLALEFGALVGVAFVHYVYRPWSGGRRAYREALEKERAAEKDRTACPHGKKRKGDCGRCQFPEEEARKTAGWGGFRESDKSVSTTPEKFSDPREVGVRLAPGDRWLSPEGRLVANGGPDPVYVTMGRPPVKDEPRPVAFWFNGGMPQNGLLTLDVRTGADFVHQKTLGVSVAELLPGLVPEMQSGAGRNVTMTRLVGTFAVSPSMHLSVPIESRLPLMAVLLSDRRGIETVRFLFNGSQIASGTVDTLEEVYKR